jgi:hypothetical protein
MPNTSRVLFIKTVTTTNQNPKPLVRPITTQRSRPTNLQSQKPINLIYPLHNPQRHVASKTMHLHQRGAEEAVVETEDKSREGRR